MERRTSGSGQPAKTFCLSVLQNERNSYGAGIEIQLYGPGMVMDSFV